MAVEYHLITPFGLGQTATMTIASPCVVTIPAGTVLRDGNPVVFTTTGALPTGVVSGTTYYSRRVTDTTYHLYDTEANAKDTGSTTGRVNASGSQSGTHTITGGYWYNLPTANPGGGGNYKDRYYYGSAYQVWNSQFASYAGIAARRDIKNQLVVEFEGKWTDFTTGYSANRGQSGYYSATYTTKINGEWGSGFHNGVTGSGYVRSDASYHPFDLLNQSNGLVEGVDALYTGSNTSYFPINLGASCKVKQCIISAPSSTGIFMNSAVAEIHTNLFHTCTKGVRLVPYGSGGGLLYGNTFVGCAQTIDSANATLYHILNNVCVGNTTNWSTAPSGGYHANNVGLSDGGGGYTGGTPWTSTGATAIAALAADFKNYVLPFGSTSDFRPSGDSVAHTSSSVLVDATSQLVADLEPHDLAGNPRPSYKNGASTNWDIGCYEFDWGYGAAPASTVLTITAQVSLSGAEIRIYDLDNTPAGTYGTELAGTETHNAATYTYTGNTGNLIAVQIMQSGYEEFVQEVTLENPTQSLSITLAPDINA